MAGMASKEEKKPSLLGCLDSLFNTIMVDVIWLYLMWGLLCGVTVNGVTYHVGACSPDGGVPLYRSEP